MRISSLHFIPAIAASMAIFFASAQPISALSYGLGTAGLGAVALLLTSNSDAAENSQIATITSIEDKADIFSNPTSPGKEPQGPPPHAKYENLLYSVRRAKVGERVEHGNIIRTSTEGKVRVVYPNGDQFLVGPGSAYKIQWEASTQSNPQVDLQYGKIRGIVQGGGPRTGLKVRSRSVVMGVRGTDFFVDDGGVEGKTEISVLRGKVEVAVQSAAAAAPKKVEVQPGFSVAIPKPPTPAPALSAAPPGASQASAPVAPPASIEPQIELKKTTQEDFKEILAASQVKPAQPSAAAPKEIVELEKTAVQTAINDIKKSDPELYAKLDASKLQAASDISAVAVQSLVPKAPPGEPKKSKPKLRDLQREDSTDSYDHYFKKGASDL